jgi:hypothetical protein
MIKRIDLSGVSPQPPRSVAHGGQIDQGRHPGKILQQHAGGAKRDLLLRRCARFPFRQGRDVFGAHGYAVLVANQVFQEYLEGHGQAGDLSHPPFLESIEEKDFIGSFPDRHAHQGAEAVGGLLSHGPLHVSVVKKMVPRTGNPLPSGEEFSEGRRI